MPTSDSMPPDLHKHPWRRPSGCSSASNCVEVAIGPAVLLRDSTDPDRRLTLSAPAWAGFLATVKAGGFDA